MCRGLLTVVTFIRGRGGGSPMGGGGAGGGAGGGPHGGGGGCGQNESPCCQGGLPGRDWLEGRGPLL